MIETTNLICFGIIMHEEVFINRIWKSQEKYNYKIFGINPFGASVKLQMDILMSILRKSGKVQFQNFCYQSILSIWKMANRHFSVNNTELQWVQDK